MAFSLVKSPDAFFQSQQWFIDFCTVDFGLFILVHVISSPFIPCQINEGNFGKLFFSIFQNDLHDGVRPWRISIGGILWSDSESTSNFYDI